MKREILAAKGREKKIEAGKVYGEGHPKEVLSIIDKSSEPRHNTRDEIAKDLGWSTG
jgi:hypothetical protein